MITIHNRAWARRSSVIFKRLKSEYRIKRTLPVSKPVMMEVVGNVSEYSKFVPYCNSSDITEFHEGQPSKAVLQIGWNNITDSFESVLKYTPDSVTATASEYNSLFSKLMCKWTVKEVNDQRCLAELDLQFQFKNPIYDMVASQAGSLVAKRMVEAFSKRASAVSTKED